MRDGDAASIEALLNDLFTSGDTKVVVDRLVLTTASGQDIGGWGRQAIKQKLIKFVEDLER